MAEEKGAQSGGTEMMRTATGRKVMPVAELIGFELVEVGEGGLEE